VLTYFLSFVIRAARNLVGRLGVAKMKLANVVRTVRNKVNEAIGSQNSSNVIATRTNVIADFTRRDDLGDVQSGEG